jgi:hypothetical protein
VSTTPETSAPPEQAQAEEIRRLSEQELADPDKHSELADKYQVKENDEPYDVRQLAEQGLKEGVFVRDTSENAVGDSLFPGGAGEGKLVGAPGYEHLADSMRQEMRTKLTGEDFRAIKSDAFDDKHPELAAQRLAFRIQEAIATGEIGIVDNAPKPIPPQGRNTRNQQQQQQQPEPEPQIMFTATTERGQALRDAFELARYELETSRQSQVPELNKHLKDLVKRAPEIRKDRLDQVDTRVQAQKQQERVLEAKAAVEAAAAKAEQEAKHKAEMDAKDAAWQEEALGSSDADKLAAHGEALLVNQYGSLEAAQAAQAQEAEAADKAKRDAETTRVLHEDQEKVLGKVTPASIEKARKAAIAEDKERSAAGTRLDDVDEAHEAALEEEKQKQYSRAFSDTASRKVFKDAQDAPMGKTLAEKARFVKAAEEQAYSERDERNRQAAGTRIDDVDQARTEADAEQQRRTEAAQYDRDQRDRLAPLQANEARYKAAEAAGLTQADIDKAETEAHEADPGVQAQIELHKKYQDMIDRQVDPRIKQQLEKARDDAMMAERTMQRAKVEERGNKLLKVMKSFEYISERADKHEASAVTSRDQEAMDEMRKMVDAHPIPSMEVKVGGGSNGPKMVEAWFAVNGNKHMWVVERYNRATGERVSQTVVSTEKESKQRKNKVSKPPAEAVDQMAAVRGEDRAMQIARPDTKSDGAAGIRERYRLGWDMGNAIDGDQGVYAKYLAQEGLSPAQAKTELNQLKMSGNIDRSGSWMYWLRRIGKRGGNNASQGPGPSRP